jgi:hypothetical protein
VSGLADQVDDRSVILASLQMRNVQLDCLVPTQTARDQNGQKRKIPLPFHRFRIRSVKQADRLIWQKQLPSRTPIFFTPFTRRIPAARSALSSPQSEASYASRRTAPSRRLTVPGASFRDSRWIRYRSTTVRLRAAVQSSTIRRTRQLRADSRVVRRRM